MINYVYFFSTTFSTMPGTKVTYDGDDRSMYLDVGFDASWIASIRAFHLDDF